MKKRAAILTILFFFLTAPAGIHAGTAAKGGKETKTALRTDKKTAPKKHRSKKFRYVSPPGREMLVEKIPLKLPISPDVVHALSNNDIDGAVRALRKEPPASKTLYILREAQRISSFQKEKKPPLLDRHRFFQNLGIAYHNLFMFLKKEGITNKDFYKKGLKYYKKAHATKSIPERCETLLLMAVLEAAYGNTARAEKIFAKIDIQAIESDFRTAEYLAEYYAAIGDEKSALERLKEAYDLNPNKISLWVAVSDNFFMLEKSNAYKELTEPWIRSLKKK